MKKFINPLDPDDLKIRAAIRQWTIDSLKLNPYTELEIIEHLCTEANCLHTETIIKVENTEGIHFYKIAKPLTFIRKLDVQNMVEINSFMPIHRH